MKTTWIGLAGVMVLVAGCDLYSPGHHDCYEVCSGGPATGAYSPPVRDPYTGECDYSGPYGGDGCYQVCDGIEPPKPEPLVPPDQDESQWPQCESACTGLSADQCHDTAGCQAVYGVAGNSDAYLDCWAVGPAPQPGACEQLDALACSQRDDCENLRYDYPNTGATLTFYACRSEGEARHPWGTCESFNPADCAEVDGERPECPDGTEPGMIGCQYTGYCIPGSYDYCDDDSNPGSCYEADTLCDVIPPDCPDGTLAGIADGCYSGFCIPVNACELPPSCDQLTSEAACLSVDACVPYYQGENCSCAGDTCTCESYVFQSCG